MSAIAISRRASCQVFAPALIPRKPGELGSRRMILDVGIELTYGSGKYRDNLTTNVTDPYRGGTDAGNNYWPRLPG